jgi:ketopantoate hydroxymethyltransferase
MCIFKEFPCLYDLGILVVAHLGAVPEEAPNLESFLPQGLETVGFYDDIWVINVWGEC